MKEEYLEEILEDLEPSENTASYQYKFEFDESYAVESNKLLEKQEIQEAVIEAQQVQEKAEEGNLEGIIKAGGFEPESTEPAHDEYYESEIVEPWPLAPKFQEIKEAKSEDERPLQIAIIGFRFPS